MSKLQNRYDELAEKLEKLQKQKSRIEVDTIIEAYLKNNKPKVIEIQRSKGYSTRESISIEKIESLTIKLKLFKLNLIVLLQLYKKFYVDFQTVKL